jgi:hypothetical protein
MLTLPVERLAGISNACAKLTVQTSNVPTKKQILEEDIPRPNSITQVGKDFRSRERFEPSPRPRLRSPRRRRTDFRKNLGQGDTWPFSVIRPITSAYGFFILNS